MTTTTSPATLIPIEPPLLPTLDFLYRFNREQYRQLEESGIIPNPKRIELIDGLLVEKPVITPYHMGVCRHIREKIRGLIPEGWFLDTDAVVGLTDSEPEPDASIVRGGIEDFDAHHPEPADVGMVIEVSLSTLRFDRRDKYAKYAEVGISHYWIINLVDRQIEVYSDPEAFKTPASYATQAIYKPGDAVPIVLDGQTVATIPVDELLP